MIISNGTYYIETQIGGGEDELGRPLETIAEWGAPLPCRITTNKDNRFGRYEDGKFRQADFTMLIDGVQPFPHKRVRLVRQDENLGEYNVVSAEPLEAVGATKIILSR